MTYTNIESHGGIHNFEISSHHELQYSWHIGTAFLLIVSKSVFVIMMSVGTYNGTSSWLWCFSVHISTFNQHNQIDLSTRQTKRQLALSRHTSVARHLAFMRVIESDLRCRRLYRSVCTPADLAAALEMLLQAQRSSRQSDFLHEDTPDLFNYHDGIWNEMNARYWSMSMASISHSSDYGCWFTGGCLRSSLPQCIRDE